jgi:hypothetical protein
MLVLGEVRTGLLQNSTALSKIDAAHLLDLVMGERVRVSERPIHHAASPERLVGVDCPLSSQSRASVRGVGTVLTRAAVTEGHVLQGSAYTRIRPGAGRRLPWAHYLGHPGLVETIGRSNDEDLARGFLGPARPPGALDLGAICDRAMDEVQRSPRLDRRITLRTAPTSLRWAAAPDADPAGTLQFTVVSPTLRTLRVAVASERLEAAVTLCEDLALHDWLLTTLLTMIDRHLTSAASDARNVGRLRPAIDHLLHLWMPAARVDEELLPVWERMERRPGFTRQWNACVSRIRDQVTVNAIAVLSGDERQRGMTG